MRIARFLAVITVPLVVIACATASEPSPGIGTDPDAGGGGGGDLDGSYGTIVDGAFVPPADAAAHGGVDAGVKDSGTGITPIDSGSSPPPTSDECPSGNTAEYDAEWFASETPCTPGDGDCDPGDCCFDRSLGSGDPFCITP
jgi:hypothetical protein